MSHTKSDDLSPQATTEAPVNPERRAFLGKGAVMAAPTC